MIALAQLDTMLGKVDRNFDDISAHVQSAEDRGANLVVFPELSVQGYALDTVAEDVSISASDERLSALSIGQCDVVVGFLESSRLRRYNSAAYVSRGQIVHVHRKAFFPGAVEYAYSSPGDAIRAFDTRIARTAVLVCYDAWHAIAPWLAVQDGAELLVIPANSVSNLDLDGVDMIEFWEELLTTIARFQQCWVVFVNRVGNEADREFWGGSRVVDPTGKVVARAQTFGPELLFCEIDIGQVRRRRVEMPLVGSSRIGLVKREIERLDKERGA